MRQIIASHDLKALFGSTRRDAQELLPQLIRRLVLASCGDNELPDFRMPSGDDIRLQGWDGALRFTGVHPWIPTGQSRWEMSISESIEGRAEANFAKRTDDPLGADLTATEFVFVTPLLWPAKDSWANRKKAEAVWKDIRVIDGSDLAAWLERAPAVALWLADAMARPIRGLDSLNRYWERTLETRYSSRVTPRIVIGGRLKEADEFRNWLQSPSKAVTIVGETTDEAVVFAAAVLRETEESSNGASTERLLFVSDAAATEHLATLSQDHIAVLTDPSLFAHVHAEALRHLHLVVPEKREARVSSAGASISLGQLRRSKVTEALQESGLSKDEAERTAAESKGSLQAVLWMIAKPERGALTWASGRAALELAPLVLAGQWMVNDHADHEILGHLSQKSYSEIRQTLAEWSGPGKPLERRGEIWDWKAWAFAWTRLAPSLTRTDIDRFAKIVLEVLGMPDPALELPPQDRWLANVRGKVHKYSGAMRKGLVDSVVQTAVNHTSIPDVDGQAVANCIVKRLLTGEERLQRWLSVVRWLPELAEAAPDAFLNALDDFISDKAAIEAMFTEGGMFVTSPHVHLLWALEGLAWSADHFSQVVLALGALAVVDPGGPLRNRPRNSLRALFLPWLPGTSATGESRIAGLRLLFEQFNDIAWGCATSVLPRSHDVGDPIYRPKWRAWVPERKTRIARRDYWFFQEQLVETLIEQAGVKGARWADLLESVPSLLNQNRPLGKKVLDAILALQPEILGSNDLSVLGESARRLVMRHENMQKADWSLKGQALDSIRRARERFQPIAATERCRWLFARWPEILREFDLSFDERNTKLEKERTQALEEVMAAGGVPAAIGWSHDVELPESIGDTLALISLSPVEERALLIGAFVDVGGMGHRTPEARVGFGYARRKSLKDHTWSAEAIKLFQPKLAHADLAFFCQSLPPGSFTWELVNGLPRTVQDIYWGEVLLSVLDLEECELACPKLLGARRPFAVVDLVGMLLFGLKSDSADGSQSRAVALARLMLDAPVDHLPKDESPPVADNMVTHHLDAALNFIETHGASEDDLAKWEWKWLPFVEGEQRGVKSLQRQLNRNPGLFVDLLKCVFKPHNGEEDDEPIDDQIRVRAQLAYSLIDAWRQVPGLSDAAQETKDNSSDEGMRPAVPAFVGTVDAELLVTWVTEARRLAEEAKRLNVCDHRIGRQFAYAPADGDGTWPCVAVRSVIDNLRSDQIEHGFILGVMARQGFHSVGKDGALEERLSSRFRDWCEKVRVMWPRTGAALREIADHYESERRREVERGRLDEYDR